MQYTHYSYNVIWYTVSNTCYYVLAKNNPCPQVKFEPNSLAA